MTITIDYLLSTKFQYIHNPCNEGIEWLKTQTSVSQAWENCPRGDWMIWIIDQLGLISRSQNFALQVAMLEQPLLNGLTVFDLIHDYRSLAFIDLKRQIAGGESIGRFEVQNALHLAREAANDDIRAIGRGSDWESAWMVAWDDLMYVAMAGESVTKTNYRENGKAITDEICAETLLWQANKIREMIDLTSILGKRLNHES